VSDVKARAVGAVSDALWRWNNARPAQPAAIPIGLREAIAGAVVAATAPWRVETAEDIRRLGEAVRDGDVDAAPDGVPMVMLVEDSDVPRVWTVLGTHSGDPGEPPVVSMVESFGANLRWNTDRVTDDGIAGRGPWTVVWSRGVAEW